jgi:hypothetical protein
LAAELLDEKTAYSRLEEIRKGIALLAAAKYWGNTYY